MTMALSICRQLGAYSSDVYTRCLTDLYFLPSTTAVERQRYLTEYTAHASAQLSYDDSRIYSVVEKRSDKFPAYNDTVLVSKSSYCNFSSMESVLQLFINTLIALDRSGTGWRGKQLSEAGQVINNISGTDSEMATRVFRIPRRPDMAGGLEEPGSALYETPSGKMESALSTLNAQFSTLETSILKDSKFLLLSQMLTPLSNLVNSVSCKFYAHGLAVLCFYAR